MLGIVPQQLQAMPHQCRELPSIGTDCIVVDPKSGAILTVCEFAVSDLRYSLRIDLGGCNFLGEQPPDPLIAAALVIMMIPFFPASCLVQMPYLVKFTSHNL